MIVIAIERNDVCHLSLDDEGDENRSWLCKTYFVQGID